MFRKISVSTWQAITLSALLPLLAATQSQPAASELATQQTCSFTLAPLNQSFSAAGGTGSFTVSTNATCEWTVRSLAPWITIISAQRGLGNTTSLYSVAPSFAGRQGAISLNGRILTITQDVMACPEPNFKLSSAFLAGMGSSQLELQDFNADGINDLWAFGTLQPDGNYSLDIATGKRGGEFNTPMSVVLGYKPRSLARTVVADFNRDGKMDFALADTANLSVNLNSGGVSFLPVQHYPLTINGIDITVGDFTGDQYPDVIVGSENTAQLALFVNDKTGKFNAANVINLTETSTPPLRLAARDFNNDGKLDLLYLINRSSQFIVLRGNGSGGFERGQLYSHIDNTVGGVVEPHALSLSDVTGDGRVDAVITSSKGLSVIPGLSGGGFGAATMYLRNQSPSDAFLGDFNGDGITDLAVIAGLINNLVYLRGLGGGRFAPPEKFLVRGAVFARSGAIPLDWNEDGLTDLAITSPSNNADGLRQGLAVTFGHRLNGFDAPRFRSLPTPQAAHMSALTDVNADGLPDLVMTYGLDSNQGGIAIQYGSGNGFFRSGPTYLAAGPVQLEITDINQDGAPDFIVANRDRSSLAVWRNDRHGAFMLASEPETNRGLAAFALADFDNNGTTDLLATIPNATGARVLSGKSDGTFNVTTQTFSGTGWTTGDFNGDGNQDVAAWTKCGFGTGTSPIVIWSGNGRGGFTEAARLSLPDALSSLSAQDLNGDGRADLVGNLCNAVSGSYFLVAFANSINFNPFIFFEGGGKSALPFSDFNGDGLPDLLGGSSRRIYVNRGDGTFQASFQYLTGFGLSADLNEDGTNDLIYVQGNEYVFIPNQARCPAASDAIITSAASYYSVKPAPNGIAALFGTGLATESRAANTSPLPTNLANTSVSLRDSQGVERLASLFFVSPNQINLLLPENTAPGLAQVRVLRNGSTTVANSVIEVLPVNPGLFAVDASGTGYPAGFALRVRNNGAQVYEPLAQYNSTLNRYTPIALDVSNAAEQVYLILYGTGLRNRSSLASVTALIGGAAAQVLYAGPQGDFLGLDQINLRVPSALAERGEVDVTVMAEGRVTNTLRVLIK